jgi:hypothetical protein
VDNNKDGSIYTFENGIALTVIDKSGKISAIMIDRKKVTTERGIEVGDSVNKIVSAYGNAIISSYDNYDLYEYFYNGSSAYILRFAVDKQNKTVKYIGVRLQQSGNAADNNTNSTISNKENAKAITQNSTPIGLGLRDAIIAKIQLNSTMSEVKSIIGSPIKVDNSWSGLLYSFKNGLELTVANKSDKVSAIMIDQNKFTTERGIKVGDSVNKIISAYGNANVSSYGHYDLYEYSYNDSSAYILRFVVDKQSKAVEYIVVRLQ